MYEFLVRSSTYVWELLKILWNGTISFFTPGQFGFLVILFCAITIVGKYGRQILYKRSQYRQARIFTRVIQGCWGLIVCFAAYQLVQAVYPMVVKAVSAIK
jgi:hypothetical protein